MYVIVSTDCKISEFLTVSLSVLGVYHVAGDKCCEVFSEKQNVYKEMKT